MTEEKGPQEITSHGHRFAKKVCRVHDSINELHTEADHPRQQRTRSCKRLGDTCPGN